VGAGVWLAGRSVGSGVSVEGSSDVGVNAAADGLTGWEVGGTAASGRQACRSRLAVIIKEIASQRGRNHMDAILLQRVNRSFGLLHLEIRKDIMCLSGIDFATEVYDFIKT
jgi:hypothetical protein